MQILLALALALSCSTDSDQIAALRAEGPSALARLLEQYRTLSPGIQKDRLEATIDAVAAQRYATVSGLYWYTDLAQAEEAAHASGKPILSLRMLGRLDEDLSCANSRFFRVALYANANVSQFLRDNFVLHWSSERPVPKVTVDFGAGRVLCTTIAGNSAHYVLDADGRVIDVLPGLYSPVAFQRELEALLPLARQSPPLDDADRTARIRELVKEHDAGLPRTWEGAGSDAGALFEEYELPGIRRAESVAFSKSLPEVAMLPAFVPSMSPAQLSRYRVLRPEEARLDPASRVLFQRLAEADLDPKELQKMLEGFERAIAADTQLNELRVRPYIHARMLAGPSIPAFAELNERIYAEIFWTPRSDPWLGLRTKGFFSALPNGGLSR